MLVKYKPKDMPKNKKAAQMGSVKGKAALKAAVYLFITFTCNQEWFAFHYTCFKNVLQIMKLLSLAAAKDLRRKKAVKKSA